MELPQPYFSCYMYSTMILLVVRVYVYMYIVRTCRSVNVVEVLKLCYVYVCF